MLVKADKQINTTDDLVAAQHPDFAHIPADLTGIGLIVTMERFDLANARPIQDLLDVTPNIPTTVAASEDIERLVTLQGTDVGYAFSVDLKDGRQSIRLSGSGQRHRNTYGDG